MLLTLWSILVTVGSLFFFGLPVAEWLADTDMDRERIWVIAPFFGLGIITLASQNLVYLNVQLSVSALLLWPVGILLWIWLIAAGRLPKLLSVMPRPVLFAASAVYLVQGVGLLVIGARYYIARGWLDQFNYTAISQFLVDYPFSTLYGDIRNQPFLITAVNLKLDRIGVSIFQGFLSVSTLTDAKTVFEPAILLAPSLTMLAIYLLARRLDLSAPAAAFAAIGAGVVPALTTVHLESFFSQALGIPYLMILSLFAADLAERTNWKRVLAAAFILATGLSLYTEFHVIFVGTIALVLGFSAVPQREKVFRSALVFLLVNGIAVLMNFGALPSIYGILGRVAAPDILANIYPWAFTLEGLGRLWLGDAVFLARFKTWLWPLYIVFSISLLICAYLGLGLLFWKRKDNLSLSVLVLALLPVGIRLSNHYPYQFYKLLLSISPLLLLGLAGVLNYFHLARQRNGLFRNMVPAGMVALIFIFCAGSIGTTVISGIFPIVGRSDDALRMLSPGARQVQDMLSAMRGQSILVVSDDSYMNAWLAYFSRHNRVWLSNPRMSDVNIQGMQNFNDLPGEVFVLTPSAISGTLNPSIQPVWSADPYYLGKIAGQGWTLLLGIQNANGIEDWSGETGFWLGEGHTDVDLLSSKTGDATITAEFTPGPSLPDVPDRRFRLQVGQAFTLTTTIPNSGLQSFTIPVVAGLNHFSLSALDRATLRELPSGDARALILGVRGLRVNFGKHDQ
jgi:hypothetical protein